MIATVEQDRMPASSPAKVRDFLGLVAQVFLGMALCLFPFEKAIAESAQPNPRQVLEDSVRAMGGVVPEDLTAIGTFSWITGDQKESGQVKTLTRTTIDSKEIFDFSGRLHEFRFQNGDAAECENGTCSEFPLERSVNSFTSHFPLAVFKRALDTPETSFQYSALETVEGAPAHHIRFWDFNDPGLPKVRAASVKDVWISVETRLPIKLAWIERMNWGGDGGVEILVVYSDFRPIGNVLLPFAIEKNRNGSPWVSIRLQETRINVGLTEGDFNLKGD